MPAGDDPLKYVWIKSDDSNGNGGNNCVEVALLDEGLVNIIVRDSKDPEGPILVFTQAEWEAFLSGVKKSQFEIAQLPAMKWRGKGKAPRKSQDEAEQRDA